MPGKTIFFSNLALYNLGCEAILRGSIRILRDTVDPELKFVMPSHYPESDRNRIQDLTGVDIVPMSTFQGLRRYALRKLGFFTKFWTPRFSTRHFKPSQLLATLSVGGDMYTLYDNDLPWDLVKLGDYSLARGVPYVIWGATMESFEKRPDLLPLLLEHLKSCLLIAARDQKTADYLERHGVSKNVKAVTDPAFCMDPIPFDFDEFLPERTTDIRVGVNVSPLSQRYHPKVNLLEETARGIEHFIDRTGQSVILVSHVFSPELTPGYDDREYHEKVFAEISPKYHPFIGRANKDVGSPRMKYLISRLDAYAGTRMHSSIAAYSSHVPTIALAYSEKAIGLNEILFGDNRWLLPIPEITGLKLADKLIEILEQREAVQAHLKSKIETIKGTSLQAGKFLAEALKGKRL